MMLLEYMRQKGGINVTDTTIETSGTFAFGSAVNNATISLDRTTIKTIGTQSNGVSVGVLGNANVKIP